MAAAWILLQCVECGNEWEGTPNSLPAPGNEFECPYCGATQPVAELIQTAEGLELLETFHG